MWHFLTIELTQLGTSLPGLAATANGNWWPAANMATHLLIAVSLLWWLLEHRRQRRSREELQSAMAAFDRLFEVTADVSSDVESHTARMQELHERISELRTSQPSKKPESDLRKLVDQLLESNAQLMNRLGLAETQLVDQRREIQRHASAAQRDSLTGLWNRRAFDSELLRQLTAFEDLQTPVVLLLIDIDYFKRVNDTFGHPAGDRVLKSVVQTIARSVRSTDALYRYGGDELALILGGATIDNAMLVAEKIRAAIERMGMNTELDFKLSISCGMTAAQSGDDSASVIRRADSALFCSKELGRNRVSVHDGQKSTLLTIERRTLAAGGASATSSQPGGKVEQGSVADPQGITQQSATQTVVKAAPGTSTEEALDAACDELQKRLDEFTQS